MKMNLRSMPACLLAVILIFTACQKNADPTTDPDPVTNEEVQAHAQDQNRVSTNLDDVANEVNVALENNAFFGGRVQNTTSICAATAVADTVSNPKTITITYNGNDCANTHQRTGTIVLSMAAGMRWKNPGAVITVTFQNFKVKRLADNKSITINGSQTLTNVNGGLLFQLPTRQTIIHTITSNNMSITFDDNTQRTWNIAHKREFTYNNGVVLSVSGIGTNGSVTNAAEWGTNRFGHSFTTSITQPLVFRQDCNLRLTSGEIKHQGIAAATVTFGLNANGAPTSCPASGPYYFKLSWTGAGGNTNSLILPY